MIRGYVLGDRILQSTDSHSDWCAAHAAPGKFRLVGASAVGRSHLDEGKPRDDAFAVRVAGDWLAVARFRWRRFAPAVAVSARPTRWKCCASS